MQQYQTEMTRVSCSLCKVDLSSEPARKRRKKLHGPACVIARAVLNAELEREGQHSLEDFTDTASADTFICRSCDANLQNISEMELRLAEMKREVHSFLDGFQVMQTARKRSGGPLATSSSKRARPHAQEGVESPPHRPSTSRGPSSMQHSPGVSVSYS